MATSTKQNGLFLLQLRFRPWPTLNLLATLCCCIAFLGCSKPQTPSSGANGCTSVDGRPVGITAVDGRVIMLIWFDIVGGDCGGGGSIDDNGIKSHGTLRYGKGRMVKWTCQTNGMNEGAVSINDQAFALNSGRVFLVSCRSDPVKIEQLQRDLSGVAVDDGSLKGFAFRDAEIGRFLGDANKAVQ